MIDLTMRAKLLEAPLINKNFVQGEQKCNYEKYLLELVNKSLWFSEHFPGGFVSPTSEANGECDAINENYRLDFKLFAAKTALRANNLLSPQIIKMKDGVIAYGGSRCFNTTLEATRLFAAFRKKSLDHLYQIRTHEGKEYSIENDIKSALVILETKKNLMLFFPYEFSFDTEHSVKEAVNSIREAIESDFHITFLYRELMAGEHDTFLTCIYDNSFLIFQVSSKNVWFCDSVKADSLSSYTNLKYYTEWY